MNKHTPGPWKAHSTGFARSGKPEYEIHWSDIGECVAEVVHGEEDARLIAAAPDLLAALHNLEVAANSVRYCYDKRPENFAMALESMKADAETAREAIAKAIGQVPA